jgi:hypothetical protein
MNGNRALKGVLEEGTADDNESSCFSETAALLENEDIIQAYNQFPFTSSDDHEMEDDPSYFVVYHKYSTSDEHVFPYQSVCQEHGGVFQQLTFQATCWKKAYSTDEVLHTYEMKIVDFVRCYGTSCEPADEQALFEEFTLRPTEEKSNSPTISYVLCDGVIDSSSLTLLETRTTTSTFVDNEGTDITTEVIAGLVGAIAVAGVASLFLALCKTGETKSVAKGKADTVTGHKKRRNDKGKPPLYKESSMERKERIRRNIEKMQDSIANDPEEQWPGAASDEGDEEYAEWSTKR